MTTMGNLIDQTRLQVNGALSEPINVLASEYQPGDATINLAVRTEQIAPGMILSSGLNSWYVSAYAQSTGEVSVVSSPNGEPDTPLPVGARIRIRPRFTDFQIFTWLNSQISVMSSSANGLWRLGSWQAPVDAPWNTYQVPDELNNMLDVIRVRHLVVGSPDQWTEMRQYAVQRQDGKTTIRVYDPHITFGTMDFIVKSPLTQAASTSADMIADCGLSESMLDIPVLGATAHMMIANETQRLHLRGQGDTRRPDEVPPSHGMNMSAYLFRRRDERINEEYARLTQAFPPISGRW